MSLEQHNGSVTGSGWEPQPLENTHASGMMSSFRMFLAELLMGVQIWLAPKTPEGDRLLVWVRNYLADSQQKGP